MDYPMWNPKDFEATYNPKSIDDIVYPNERSKTLIDQLVSGARPFPIPEGKCGILLYQLEILGITMKDMWIPLKKQQGKVPKAV